jgi:aminopeptidase-like protein
MNVTKHHSDFKIGNQMHDWAKDLFPICRSITGPGVRETLKYIQNILPELKIHSVPSGTKAFDWTVPDEWIIRDAFVLDDSGNKIIDFNNSNLHVLNYSEPVDKWLELDELKPHLYSLPKQPNAIPYVTSYYQRNWGFCLTDNQRKILKPGQYHAVVDSELRPGVLNYGELIIPGETEREIFISTYICHPSMANNELSGPVVTTALAQWLSSLEKKHYTYRIIFIPETIGSIVYLSRNLDYLKKNVIAGFNINCVGDDRCFSFLPSRDGKTLSDKVALHVLKSLGPQFKRYTWLDRGSDERQYCAPGLDLPVVNMMRSKHGTYPEYHTSLDDLSFVTPSGLEGGLRIHQNAIKILEKNTIIKNTVLGEPQLGKRGLRPNIGEKDNLYKFKTLMDILSYSDGKMTILEIANAINESFNDIYPIVDKLVQEGLLTTIYEQ